MNKLYEFLRRHPTLVDGFWGFMLFAMTILWLIDQMPELSEGQETAGGLTAVMLGTVVTLRRRRPGRMLLLAIAVGLFQLLTGVEPNPGNFAFLVIIFTVASRQVRWASRLALAGALAAPAAAALRWFEPDDYHSTGAAVFEVCMLTVCFALAWVLGDSLRTRRAYYAELEERAGRLEQEREARARMAVVAERARIARELHDVVAHNVSVMVVQADGAAYVLDKDVEQARNALRTISTTGRQALTEMRRLLGVLRESNATAGGAAPGTAGAAAREQDYLPQPGVEQLGELVQRIRDTGLPVDFRIEGSPRPLPSGVELTAYRIVQEALTNTRKHAGPQAGARVRLRYGGDTLTVLAEDDGQGARPFGEYHSGGADGLGHGLIGMRERVGMVGGELRAGPRPGGGFRISATLPLQTRDCPA
ncbi:sensor histidine kinase [Streptomyces aidingensis]|uniref:histidine kinase n=1 Tax=Streptomyces aidingensis TaxID=910347 RepID=A0A1I1R5G2_9ACTN|nr:sensor histidine kinase [Streptomyces aidingensis]SFD29417.1 Histidine kinase-, DNA gyrase B-, and HSP90-like ATPase [Streptomyces aidingensis]